MTKPKSQPISVRASLKKWTVNIVILLAITLLMLVLAEGAMRWWDGYQLSSLELNQQPAAGQITE